jgi:glyoxylase-like metal-dependent hydrolase (beta-lactamase superfamily II)
MASPSKRLAANVAGDFFVDSSCIDCGTCYWMAPATFERKGDFSHVYKQPGTPEETLAALKALVACPTGSIGTAKTHDVRAVAAAFPDPIEENIYHCGYHHEDSFGAASYFITRPEGNVLVDSPRFASPLLKRIEALGGIDLMFLTHRDDVADHEKFAKRFGCRRVLHRDDVTTATRSVEVQPEGMAPIELAADLTMIPVPGHTRGSACLLYKDKALFSGDHAAWSMARRRVYAFRDACWYDWRTQIESMKRLLEYGFEFILPGHGAPCRFPHAEMKERMRECVAWMESRRERT